MIAPNRDRVRSIRVGAIVLAALASAPGIGTTQERPSETQEGSTLVSESLRALVALQDERGLWPYEGRYRVDGEIPLTYEIGGTSLACLAILHAAENDDEKARAAMHRGLRAILDRLDDGQMRPSTELRYDMRVLAQAYALLLFCHLKEEEATGPLEQDVDRWIPHLAEALVIEQMKDGGWNYQGRPVHASFVTASVSQALLWARKPELQVSRRDPVVPRQVLLRAREALRSSRTNQGAFHYFGARRGPKSPPQADRPAGSAARTAICETMLFLMGGGSRARIRDAVETFHEHWDELENRRKKPGTHEGPFLIAPYYFYYGHRYTAQAIGFLPESSQARERRRLREVILRTRDPDGTFNDRIFPLARAYGTAMVILALLGNSVPPPPPLAPR